MGYFRHFAVVLNRARRTRPCEALPFPTDGALVPQPEEWVLGPRSFREVGGRSRGALGPHQLRVEGEVVAELARHQKILPDVLLALASYGPGELRVLEDLDAGVCCLGDGVY